MKSGKEVWIDLYDESLAEYLEAGMPFQEADELATRYAERNLTERLGELADYARMQAKDAAHSMFRDHRCAFCGSGTTPCRQGSPTRCEYPIARNE
jgi:hypothetical protein